MPEILVHIIITAAIHVLALLPTGRGSISNIEFKKRRNRDAAKVNARRLPDYRGTVPTTRIHVYLSGLSKH